MDAGKKVQAGELPMTGCKGLPMRWQAMRSKMENHSLATAPVQGLAKEGMIPIICCIKCGIWAERRMVGLAGPCRKSIDRYGAGVLRCISLGKHPDTHRGETVEQTGGIDLGGHKVLSIMNGEEGIDVGAGQRGGNLPGPYPRKEGAQPSRDHEGQPAPKVVKSVGGRVREAKQCMPKPATGILPGLEAIRQRISAKCSGN